MYLNNFYYRLKPIIPRRLQILLRRKHVQHRLSAHSDVWPIDEKAGNTPQGWPGWLGDKKFAMVLSHDVETTKGHENCRKLADIEMDLGFRSSFNFVPERYNVSVGLRHYLTDKGFEVGVHGLVHDGKLYRSRMIFIERALKINKYIKEWDAKGFCSPSMHNNLKWIHDLNIEYDSSTFDTDPFEPQSYGMRTIFPFWIPNGVEGNGYVELPYTLPQDFTLFVIMEEETIDIWKRKLDWLVENGGMVLMTTHPDYMNFKEKRESLDEYPVKLYREFLDHIKSKYEGEYWSALPKDIASFWKSNMSKTASIQSLPYRGDNKYTLTSKKKWTHVVDKKNIWIDLDNSPHVVFFRPIIEELKKCGYNVVITARNCFQVCGLADDFNLQYKRIGRHYGKSKILKILGTLFRSFELIPHVFMDKPIIAISHGSRAQVITSKILGIPSVVIFDYEYTKGSKVLHPTWLMAPDLIFNEEYKDKKNHNIGYPGIKEDVYAHDLIPDPSILEDLGINNKDLLVTIRPPATEAHYHNPESEILFKEIINYLKSFPDIRLFLLPRNENQEESIKNMWPEMCENGKLLIPEKVVNGPNLIWYSDLVISGGGTMNREAAALGVPVYSIFRGKIGAIDRHLVSTGRLTLIESVDDIHTKILITRRDKSNENNHNKTETKDFIVNSIIKIIENRY